MQILSVSADHYASNHNYLNQMHRLRAAVFGGRLEWDVTITEQGERDHFGAGVVELFLHIALVDLGLGGKAGGQRP